jgi:L-alanine-DL-glutamate epimerase-like enolase superfamily enzyme
MSTAIDIEIVEDCFPTRGVFTIARGSRTQVDVLTVSLICGSSTGRGECVPYARYDETLESVTAQLLELKPLLRQGLDRAALQQIMPPGAARNAVDCALWDLESKITGKPVWQLAALPEPVPVTTAFTLSLDTADAMQASAQANAHRPLLKIKLGGDNDIDRLQAVRRGAPDSQLIVDANEGWTATDYAALAPVMLSLGVALVEQPLPATEDSDLEHLQRPLPVCADEACHDRQSLASLNG